MFKIFDGRDSFYQWDTGCKLIVDDASIAEVHFCNRTDSCALVCETYVDGGLTLVDVPNIILQQSYKLHIYAYDGAQTRYDKCYDVRARSKPADYIYTETEVKTFDKLSADLEALMAAESAAEEQRQENEAQRIAAEQERSATIEDITNTLHLHEIKLANLTDAATAGFETDSSTAYTKAVPANALTYAELEKSSVQHYKKISTNLYKKALEGLTITTMPPYTVGERIRVGTINLQAGTYYINSEGYAINGGDLNDTMAMLVLGDSNSRYITLDTAQEVAINILFNTDTLDDYELKFTNIGVFAVSYDGEWVNYEPYYKPYLLTKPLKKIASRHPSDTSQKIDYFLSNELVALQKTMVRGEGDYSYDYIDWTNKKLFRCMKAIDMGALEWTYSTSGGGRFYTTVTDMRKETSKANKIGILCSAYTYTGTGTSALVDGGICNIRNNIYVKDSNYTNVDDFKAAIAGVTLYYEMTETVVEDIDTGDFDRFIKVYPSGTVAFIDDTNTMLVAPTTITYQLKGVAE